MKGTYKIRGWHPNQGGAKTLEYKMSKSEVSAMVSVEPRKSSRKEAGATGQ